MATIDWSPKESNEAGTVTEWEGRAPGLRVHVNPVAKALIQQLESERDRYKSGLMTLADDNTRYLVLADDGSLVPTDDLLDGDNVVLDRGADH